ncbi:MAG: hypothetical protein JXB39_05035 [Deltaproteobacteria bacterium]|nr:hypothetical protein [Deltaproteobacteria bacterium]
MTHKEPIEEATFDTRTLDRHLADGRVSAEDVERYRASLEDCADLASWTATRMTKGAGVHVAPTEEDSEEDGAE